MAGKKTAKMSTDKLMAQTINNLIDDHLDKENGEVALDWFARCYSAYLVVRALGLIDAAGRSSPAPRAKVAAATKRHRRRHPTDAA